MSMAGKLALVDTRDPAVAFRLYHIALFERVLRQLFKVGVKEIFLWTRPDSNISNLLRKDFTSNFNLNLIFANVTPDNESEWLDGLPPARELIGLNGSGVYDLRVIEQLASMKGSSSIEFRAESPLAVNVPTNLLISCTGNLSDRLKQLKDSNRLAVIESSSMSSYVRFLRRRVDVQLTKIQDSKKLRELEDEMYENTFKGTMEWIAVYGYRIPVRELTRLVSSTQISPNHITSLALLCSFGAIPLFALGHIALGLSLAGSFIILDSLDGKLARMTIRYSSAADRWDHLTSAPTRMAWYLSLGWHLSNHDLASPLGIAAIVYGLMPVVDKLTGVAFNARFGRSPLDYTPLDAAVHLYTVRKNDIALMAISLPLGLITPAYLLCSVWAAATWLWHVARFAWFALFARSGADNGNRDMLA